MFETVIVSPFNSPVSRTASVGFEQRQALIGDVINLVVTDKHVFAAAFGALQRAVALAHFRVSGNHLCVTGAAHAVANLAGPSLISGICQEFLHGRLLCVASYRPSFTQHVYAASAVAVIDDPAHTFTTFA